LRVINAQTMRAILSASVNANMELLPGASCCRTVLLHKPLAGTAQFQAGAVHQEMHRPGSRAWSRVHLQRRRPTAERGVIRDGELKAKQADDRTVWRSGRRNTARSVKAVSIANGE
jgi:hypothetical protein